MSEQLGYGYVSDTDESLQSKSGGVFGGNFGNVSLKSFKFISSLVEETEPADPALQAIFVIGDKEAKVNIRPVTSVYVNNEKTSDFSSPEALTALKIELAQNNAVVTHIIKAVGVTEEAIKNALSVPTKNFAEYGQKIESLLPVGYQNIPLDLFMEYQWNIGQKADGTPLEKSYPTIPRNMKGGYWLCKSMAGKWEAITDEEGGLAYVNEQGQKHLFKRTKNFMESRKGTQQFSTGASPQAGGAMAPSPSSVATTKNPSEW